MSPLLQHSVSTTLALRSSRGSCHSQPMTSFRAFTFWATVLAITAVANAAEGDAAAPASFAVTIRVDAAKPVGEMKPIWRFFGADEPNYATMKDGRKLLS